MEELITQINTHCKLSKQEEMLIRQTARILHFPKDAMIIESGKIDDSLYFIQEGVWRAYTERDGEQTTLWFAVPGEVVFSTWGYAKGIPARYSIAASCNSTALEVKKKTLEMLSETSPGLSRWINEIFLDLILSNDDLIVDLSSPRAEKRYLAFMKKLPEIFQNVPLKEIASCIGVTPQSLSRIRAGLNAGKKNELAKKRKG